MITKSNCSLCSEIQNNNINNLFIEYKINNSIFNNRLLYLNKYDTYILPTIGCFKAGYFLFITVAHVQSFFSLGNRYKYYINSFIQDAKISF